jgi:hypothetical protein
LRVQALGNAAGFLYISVLFNGKFEHLVDDGTQVEKLSLKVPHCFQVFRESLISRCRIHIQHLLKAIPDAACICHDMLPFSLALARNRAKFSSKQSQASKKHSLLPPMLWLRAFSLSFATTWEIWPLCARVRLTGRILFD